MPDKKLLIIILLFLIIACTSNRNFKVEYLYNMDDFLPWYDEPIANIISDPAAHSGIYVCRLDSIYMFSPTFQSRLGAITAHPIKGVKVSAWIKLENEIAAPQFIIEIKNGQGKIIATIRKGVKKIQNGMRWHLYENNLNVNSNGWNNPDNSYRIYVLNSSRSFVLVDDIKIIFY